MNNEIAAIIKRKKKSTYEGKPSIGWMHRKENQYQHFSNYFTAEEGQNKIPKPFYKAITLIIKFDQDKRK